MQSSKASCCAWFHKCGMGAGLFVLRLTLAIVLIYSGYTKLFGGMDMFSGMVAGLGFPAATFFAWAAALAEFVGGIAILLGIATRVSSVLVAITMLVAIVGVTGNSFMMSLAPMLVLGGSIALFCTGAGSWSVCRWTGRKCGMMCGCCQGEACGTDMGACGCCKGGEEKMKNGKK